MNNMMWYLLGSESNKKREVVEHTCNHSGLEHLVIVLAITAISIGLSYYIVRKGTEDLS